MLKLTKYEQASFHCNFDDIKDYPFEHQDCYFEIFSELMENIKVELIAGNLIINKVSQEGQTIGHYSIVRWSMKSSIGGNFNFSLLIIISYILLIEHGSRKIKVTVEMRRKNRKKYFVS